MPQDVLLELEGATPVAANLENVEALVRVVVHELGAAVTGVNGSAQVFEQGWRRIVVDVAKGQTAEMHALRPRFASAFEQCLGLLKEIYRLASWLRQLGREDVADPDVLLPQIAGMERLSADVLDRWQTASDLEDLAARDYPLTKADLDRIGPQCRPPASWFAEESKPF